MTAAEVSGPDNRFDPQRLGGIGDISGDVQSVISDPQSPVNTGSAPQLNFDQAPNTVIGLQQIFSPPLIEAARAAAGVAIAAAGIEDLREAFVPPDTFDALRQRLQKPGASVILTGPPGSGRRATAKMLLSSAGDSSTTLRLLAGPDLQGEDRLTADDVAEGDRLLLDVSDIDHATFLSHQRDLLTCVSIVHERAARMVILVPDRHDLVLDDDLKSYRVAISRPNRWQVLAAHLKSTGLSVSAREIRAADARVFDQLPLRNVARVAEFLKQTYPFADHHDEAAWFGDALAGLADHEDEVIELVAGLKSVEERTLLLTAAMLEDAAVDAVHAAERMLQGSLRYKAATDSHQLAEPGITDRIRALKDTLTISADGKVRFSRVAFGSAVLSHFWDAYPDLRGAFARWVSRSPTLTATGPGEREAVALRFAVQAARTNSLRDLFKLVEVWAETKRDEQRRLATVIMTTVLLDEGTGQAARGQMYTWARSSELEVGLGRLLVPLCRDVIAAGHLKQALIRLRWLADRQPVADDARQAIAHLCADNRSLEQFLYVLTDRDRFDGELCRVIVTPERLTGRGVQPAPIQVPRLARQAVKTWQRALAPLSVDDWTSLVIPWLERHAVLAAKGDRATAAALLAATTALCDGQVASLARLFHANRVWLRSRGQTELWRRSAAAAVEEAVHRSWSELPKSAQRIEGRP